MESRQLAVYVQALPVSIPSSAKKFSDLESCEFKMSHSSKTALSLALGLGFHEIVAVGYSPILHEAIARGATSCVSMPLSDDALEQYSFFPEENFSHFLIGENPDWIFSGSSLAGILAQDRNLKLCLFSRGTALDFPESSVILVKDSGESSRGIDVKRIKAAFEVSVNKEEVVGNSTLSKKEPRKTESLTGSAEEISSILSRRIKRMTGA